MKTLALRRGIESIVDGPFGSNLASEHYVDEGARVVRLGNIGSMEFREEDRAFISFEHFEALSRHEVVPGDVLVAGLGDDRNAVGRACISPSGLGPALVKADCFRLRVRPEIFDARYVAWFLNSSIAAHSVELSSRGATRVRATPSAIADVQTPNLDLQEQRRIADFLDDQVSRVDDAVGARRSQIELISLRIQSANFDMVRGANQAGPDKASGLAWLGSVPASWPMLRVNVEFEVVLGKMLDEKRFTGTDPIPYLRNTNVQWDTITTDDLKVMDIPGEEFDRFTLRRGDLLICEGGQPGRCAVWDGRVEPIGFQKALHRARSRGRSRVEWLAACLRAATTMNAFAVENGQTTIGHLTNEQLRAQRFPFPDAEVQDSLMGVQSALSAECLDLRSRLERSIELLTEYKQSLITAAVTGELNVTTASMRVPA